ncbi:MAG TPA: type II secretion system protein [Verrucomicrobiae bacterium]|nr:type II secretion system protein [Verrucomicrobiae bacterium]
MTLIEVLVIMAIIGVFAAVLTPALFRAKARALRISCTGHLKQIGLGTYVWEGDHLNKYPMSVPGTNGGTMEFTSGTTVFRNFQVLSNELSTPFILICPADTDRNRFRATNFAYLNNSNLSYFVGLDANETDPQGILSGDRNLTNGTAVKNGILQLTTNSAAGWTDEMHKQCGNIALADGSVQQVSTIGLRESITNASPFTTRFQMPILGP